MFHFHASKLTDYSCRVAHEMLNRLYVVWLLYFIEKLYILHVRCSAELWRIVSNAHFIKCDHHAVSRPL